MPIDGVGTRLLRTAILARELAQRGHEVVYWNATFNHQQKLQRFEKTTTVRQENLYDCVFLEGRPYIGNVSLSRFVSQRQNASAFLNLAPNMPKPDIVLAGFPPVELAWAAVKFANAHSTPIALDCRDMWPDIITQRLPAPLRLVSWLPLMMMAKMKRMALSKATYITGITDRFVEWGLAAAARPKRRYDRAFHLAVSPTSPSQDAIGVGNAMWDCALGPDNSGRLVACFAGTLASRLDLITILDGIDMLSVEERHNIRIVLCGKGDMETIIRKRAEQNDSIIFGGWRDTAELAALMQRCAFGILPYPNTDDFMSSYPNKVGEYLLAGLPIMTGLDGVTGALLNKHGLKIPYQVGSAIDFASAIRSILATKDIHTQKALARQLGKDHFDPNIIYPEFASWLETLAIVGAKPNDC